MTNFDRATSPTYNEPTTNFDRATSPTHNEPMNRVPVRLRETMATTGSLFSSLDMTAGILAAVMTLGPLAMAAFAVGRY